ncbi:MAG: hypothetical protein ACYDCH_03830 [Gaiellaceae bacterium]
MSGGFQFMFSRREDEPERPDAETVRPPWLGPPEDELAVCVPLSLVLARSATAVVALTRVDAYSTGLALDLTVRGRGLSDREASRLMHDQHVHFADPDEELPPAFLRFGVELADGSRASNLDGMRAWRSTGAPDGPVLGRAGGGGGAAGDGRVSFNPGYWLWPLPPAGVLRLFVEWPALDVPLTPAELDVAPLLQAAAAAQALWPD